MISNKVQLSASISTLEMLKGTQAEYMNKAPAVVSESSRIRLQGIIDEIERDIETYDPTEDSWAGD